MSTDKENWRRAIAADFLESSAAAFAAPYLAATHNASGDAAGVVIGRYRLIEEIGRGGMGTVWLAERADGQFEQRVALKLIKRGMDSDEVLARFLRERQILARLEHHDIARLLDGGVSDDGRPYFVMELVDGIPITRYCDTHRLSIDRRLAMFTKVCRAVQFAHQSLIVHRDIKPSNVLVSESGDVKLLDFGVAKLLGETERDEATAAGRLLTPEYASPEQLEGAPVTTASDVYQLGILLYELLTGRRPYGADTTSRKDDPPHPSTIVARNGEIVRRDGTIESVLAADVSDRRGVTTDRLRKKLRGDLDAITLRALQHDVARRFHSAEAFAEDVDRHLALIPIRSGTAGWSYRAARFVRRNRVRVVAVAGLSIVLAATGVAYTSQIRAERDRAQRDAAKVSESAALLQRFFQGWSPDGADRSKVSSEVVLREATQRAKRELARDPEMLGLTLSMLGDLYSALGQLSTADSLLTQALGIQEALYKGPSTDLAATLTRRGRLYYKLARFSDSEIESRRALAAYQSLFAPDRVEVLQVQFELAIALYSRQRFVEAEAVLRDALSKSANEDAALTTEISAHLGYVLFQQARYAEAVALLRSTLSRQQRIFGRLHVSTLRTTRFLASAMRDPKDLPEVVALGREVMTTARTLFGETHPETRNTMYWLAIQLERNGNLAEAEQLTDTVLRANLGSLGETNIYTSQQLRTLGGLQLSRGDLARAEQTLRRALAGFRQGNAGDADEGDVRNRLAYLVFSRHIPDSLDVYREAVAFENARRPDDPYFITDGYEYLAWVAHRRGDFALAEKLYRRAVTLYEAQLPEGHPYRLQADAGLGQTLIDQGKVAEGERFLERSKRRQDTP